VVKDKRMYCCYEKKECVVAFKREYVRERRFEGQRLFMKFNFRKTE